MDDCGKNKIKKTGLALPMALIALAAASLLAGGALLIVYSAAIAAAWKSAMAFLVVFAGGLIVFGAGLGTVEGFRLYFKFFRRKTGAVETKTEPKTKVSKNGAARFFSLSNVALAVMLVGSVLAVVSAFLGSTDRSNWVDAKADYMESNGYYEDIKYFDQKYDISGYDQISRISISLKKKNAVIIYDSAPSVYVEISGYMSYEKQIDCAYSRSTATLTVTESDPPAREGMLNGMLFFLFDENNWEGQIQIHIPLSEKDAVTVEGVYAVAQD